MFCPNALWRNILDHKRKRWNLGGSWIYRQLWQHLVSRLRFAGCGIRQNLPRMEAANRYPPNAKTLKMSDYLTPPSEIEHCQKCGKHGSICGCSTENMVQKYLCGHVSAEKLAESCHKLDLIGAFSNEIDKLNEILSALRQRIDFLQRQINALKRNRHWQKLENPP